MKAWKIIGITAAVGTAALALRSATSSTKHSRGRPLHSPLFRRVRRQLRRAAQIMGVSEVPPLKIRLDVPNAAADDGAVYYNPRWLAARLSELCDDPLCQEALLLGLMAHELAHQQLKHASDTLAHPHGEELDADEWAGTVLARAGVSSHHLERLLSRRGDVPSPTHPVASRRVSRIQWAYRKALRQV